MRMVSIYSPNCTKMKNVNCIWNAGKLCKNEKTKRSLFGFGARKCIEYTTCKRCELKQPYLKPKKPLPAPPVSEIVTIGYVKMIKLGE